MIGHLPVAEGWKVLNTIERRGARRKEDLDQPASYAFVYRDGDSDSLFFIPKELRDGHYTLDQIDQIEQSLAYTGIDLLPLLEH